jgi:hypothetical protein
MELIYAYIRSGKLDLLENVTWPDKQAARGRRFGAKAVAVGRAGGSVRSACWESTTRPPTTLTSAPKSQMFRIS